MIIVGNIISKESLTGIPNNFNQITDLPKSYEIPNIIIGWGLTKKLFPEASILKKKIKDNLYWTFSPTEKRNNFENDLKKYIEKSYKDFIKGIKFLSIDPIIHKINSTEELILKIKNLTDGFAYLYDSKVVYVYHNNIIYSIDLEQIDFIGFNRIEILDETKKLMELFEDDIKIISKFKNEIKYLDIRYIPYLIFKNATKNITPSHIC